VCKSGPHGTSSAQVASLTWVLLLTAAIVGGCLRFYRLGSAQLSSDEGDSWAVATSSTLAAVVHLHHKFNPDKLPLDDIARHFWTIAFGDGESSLRAPSAFLGTATVLLVFLALRELLDPDGDVVEGISARIEPDAIASISALLFALNPLMIRYSREARMYSFQLAAEIGQLFFFLRAGRRAVLGDYIALGLLTALGISFTLTSLFLVAIEGVWLMYALRKAGWRTEQPRCWRLLRSGQAVVAGFVLLSPFLPKLLKHLWKGRHGLLGWIALCGGRPSPWEPIQFLERASGGLAFAVLGPLAVWGIYKGWNRAPSAVRFALLWMLGPILIVSALSWAFMPLFVDRYVLMCAVPFLFLSSLGIWQIGHRLPLIGVVAAVAIVPLQHIIRLASRVDQTGYREAANRAALSTCPTIYVLPDYANRVCKYYLRSQPAAESKLTELTMTLLERTPAERGASFGERPGCSVLIVDTNFVDTCLLKDPQGSRAAVQFRQAYPRVIGKFKNIEVRAP